MDSGPKERERESLRIYAKEESLRFSGQLSCDSSLSYLPSFFFSFPRYYHLSAIVLSIFILISPLNLPVSHPSFLLCLGGYCSLSFEAALEEHAS